MVLIPIIVISDIKHTQRCCLVLPKKNVMQVILFLYPCCYAHAADQSTSSGIVAGTPGAPGAAVAPGMSETALETSAVA